MATSRSLTALSDEELAARCRSGRDDQAFAELVDRHQRAICRYVRQIVGDADSEDLAQDVFLRAYQALPRFRGEASFRTWLYRIARNRCFTELRSRGRRGEAIPFGEEGGDMIHSLLPDDAPGLAEEIAREDLSARVREKVAALPVQYRQVLTLFYLDEMRYEEIASILDVPMGTVKTWIHRARLRLRDLIVREPAFEKERRP